MTNAPDDLLAVRRYLLKAAGLAGDAVGIVGDPTHASTGGYHEGNDDLARVGRLNADYSKRESTRDRPGTNSASALDIGDFVHGAVTLRSLTLGLVAACQRGDPRARDVREVIYTPDGRTVHRWDALGIRADGDSSHLYHTHLSFFRDSEGRRAAPDNILGLLTEFFEGAPVAFTPDQEKQLLNAAAIVEWNLKGWTGDLSKAEGDRAAAEVQRDTSLAAMVQQLLARPAAQVLTDADRAAIAAEIFAGLGQVAEDAAVRALERVRFDVAPPVAG